MISEPADHAIDAALAHEGGYVDLIRSALEREASEAHVEAPAPRNARAVTCSVESCARPAYAKGMCNGHYLRHRRGAALSGRFRSMPRSSCRECGGRINGKGGWGLCAKHFKARRFFVIKSAFVEAMGGRCQRCAGNFPTSVYDFHHVGSKDRDPSDLIANGAIESIAAEISKCVLLCANCHRIEHAN